MHPNDRRRAALAVCLAAAWTAAGAAESIRTDAPTTGELEEITVVGRRISMDEAVIEPSPGMRVDTAQMLRRAPGANVNTNGRLTGIAQYRGLYGDRVAVSLDGLCPVGGGPNAMDAPLSYAPPMILEALRVERGVPGVASVAEGIGGHVDARLERGTFADTRTFAADGRIASRYGNNGDTHTSAGRLTITNTNHRLSLVSQLDRSDDIDTPAGTIRPSALSRDRHDVSYAWRGTATEIMGFAGRLDTADTGTPSLPMDIRYIDTDLYGLSATHRLGTITLEARAGYNDVDHVMDNYTLRAGPPPAAERRNHTRGRGGSFGFSARIPVAGSELALGVDGRTATHDAVITNPNDTAFRIDNFVDVERDLAGLFAEWRTVTGSSEWELGMRFNRVSTDAGAVSVSGLSDMMAAGADRLAEAFNAADRSLDFRNLDLVASYRHTLSRRLTATVEFGSRTRAPSYQELYLWLPLQATGGLADGRTYIGNLGLDSERSNEVNVGLSWTAERLTVAPQAYYRRIDDYIQGVPAGDMTANMIASMMSGAPALEFSNVDAAIYGMDVAWRYGLTDTLALDGTASLVRGTRRDTDDHLYRLAPDNIAVGLTYRRQTVTLRSELVVAARQDRVAAYNGEQETPGYGLVNVELVWAALPALTFEAAVENVLDREYRDHLTGINRAGGSAIPVGDRLPGPGRSVTAGFSWQF